MELTLLDEFCGGGGSTEGAARVPGITPAFAANHNPQAIETHATNHPYSDHYLGDVQKITDVGETFPHCNLFWSSPACPHWTDAKGAKRTFDRSNQLALWKEDPTEEELKAMRSRALMEEVVIYLRAMHRRGHPVLAGVVENVIQCRQWDHWNRWLSEIKALGYETRVIALNSMHALAHRSPRCPQSRDRLYVAYWHTSLGRHPDWNRWLRPAAWCPDCQETVRTLQVFKNPRNDMGRYNSQYLYRCPRTTCRNRSVEPEVLPAAAAIDWSVPSPRIGDREDKLKPATLARIEDGIRKYWAPLLTPTGGTWRTAVTPLERPMPTRTTRECDGVAVPPLVVPLEARDGKKAALADQPMRTQTGRQETALALNPFVTPLRGGGDRERAYPTDRHLHTVTAGGFHHGLATPPGGADPLLVQYYGNGRSFPASGPIGALPTREHYGLADAPEAGTGVSIDNVLFRMLQPHEIQAAMAFPEDYQVLPPAKRDKVQLLGNAVTPNVAEVLLSALSEAITGEYRESGWDVWERHHS